jgi:hypothetical protein
MWPGQLASFPTRRVIRSPRHGKTCPVFSGQLSSSGIAGSRQQAAGIVIAYPSSGWVDWFNGSPVQRFNGFNGGTDPALYSLKRRPLFYPNYVIKRLPAKSESLKITKQTPQPTPPKSKPLLVIYIYTLILISSFAPRSITRLGALCLDPHVLGIKCTPVAEHATKRLAKHL